MLDARKAIDYVAGQADRAILFHSASGKDSIALLDLMHPYFKEIVCVYMYLVKDLQHINRYITYSTHRYNNVRFMQVPHFGVYSYIKSGFLGHTQNEKQRLYTLADITEKIRELTGIDWAFFGFKQSDSMNRRLMLRTYTEEAINLSSRKCYPLSKYKNSDVLDYINSHNLIQPERYGKGQSAGTDITDINYLRYLQENFKGDLQKILAEYPLAERFLFEDDYSRNRQI